ncbi:Serine/threonine protein kinase [Labilithrix luteola]|uniref:Serine/threonine protein kinase n=1 Tax=Labilithrix luteola TaxID=1391654 RepID=A0A0K1PVY0_9BACT|nr:serine/threonine-protein kinase [Labilithrix luteola]AKU97546.1 Serine/threonine protein kinase [Labilithrix luteola]
MSALPTSHCLDENDALELLEGRIPSEIRAGFERHLEACDGCRELLAELAKLGSEDPTEPMDEPAPDGAIPERLGPYRIERAAGAGSGGTVYRAVDERTGQVAAVKMLADPALRARFLREARTLSRLHHPAIVRYLDHGEVADGMYLAMEWLEGENLEERFERGPLLWQEAVALGQRISAALDHAHRLGCVHRDLSPRNVFLPNRLVANAKLLDFGLVRVHDVALARTTSRAVLGTPFYMAPEQIRDPGSVDGRADLFGLGILLYEAVAGSRPFQADDLFTLWVRIVDDQARDLRLAARTVPESFVRVVEALLAKDPAARPQTAADVHRALSATLERPASQATVAMVRPPFAPAHAPLPAPPPHVPPLARPVPTLPVYAVAPALPAIPSTPPRSGGVAPVLAALLTATTVLGGGGFLAYRHFVAKKPSGGGGVTIEGDVALIETHDGGNTENSDSSVASDEPKEHANIAPVPRAAPPLPKGARKADDEEPERDKFLCSTDGDKSESGRHYGPMIAGQADPAVFTASNCKAVLEDCTIDGPRSILMMGTSRLLLRRCKVLGDIELKGAVTLELEGSTLTHPPQLTNLGGRPTVVKR